MVKVALITGLSGSGKTTALRALEDAGWLCMDNLPVVLLPKVIELAGLESGRRIGVVVDVREPGFIEGAGAVIDELKRSGHDIDILFLDADTEMLIRRFRETRRRHPLDRAGDLRDAIAMERELLDDLRQRAAVTIDSSTLNAHELKRRVQDHFARDTGSALQVKVCSFGFKHGPLTEADLVFDVRFLPNPYFDPTMRSRNGLDADVAAFVRGREDTAEFESRVVGLLGFLLPRYATEGKVYLTIGIGCTGGQHRSVAIAEALGTALSSAGHVVTVTHRDRAHWTETAP